MQQTGRGIDRAGRLLGLGARARSVVVGVQQVRSAALRGRVVLAIVADDASAHSRAKVLPLLDARRIRVVGGISSGWLGEAVGRQATAAVAVVDAGLARGICEAFASPAGGRQNGGMG